MRQGSDVYMLQKGTFKKVAPKTLEGYNTSMAKANSEQVGGDHYKGVAVEHWDIVAQHELDYFQGQITKYVMRWKKKNGIQDLLKAEHFLRKYIELNSPADEDDGSYAGPGYVDQDRSRKDILRGEMDRARPNPETDTIVCGTCQKVCRGIIDYRTHPCR